MNIIPNLDIKLQTTTYVTFFFVLIIIYLLVISSKNYAEKVVKLKDSK